MKQEGVHELVAGYVLGALDEDERRLFDEHLATCEQCRDEVDELGGVAAALAYAPEGPPPPAALRGRILEAAGAERSKVVPLARYRRRPLFLAAAAAAACLAIGLGLWATIGSSNGPSRAQTLALGTFGTLSVSSAGEATMNVHGLPPLSRGTFYQLWVIPSKTTKTLPDVFFRRGGSHRLEHILSPGDTVALTIERQHLTAPEGQKVFQASLST